MLPSLQPHRPKVPQQPAQTTYAPQQTRAVHVPPPPTPSHTSTESQPSLSQLRPRSQIDAMPPFASSPLVPPRTIYDSSIRHPVFHTEQLRRPPFPLPAAATQGWNPVASGYIFEERRLEANGIPRTKL